ncbi:hypothetical protein EVAR_100121_1 [Eumeta japonica]|uniref:Transcriptional repressor p66 coiled-coil MBD2-interaction domain-containing protein n=1 Tax=Eumeta variegata TaxID=151549 RepID=A0A4C1ZK70_EUMVA|nr:hypothetical protein EVAR_100121_1 [Eumeta japonica]
MDVDDSAVDLSVRSLPPELSELKALTASGLTITPAQPPPHGVVSVCYGHAQTTEAMLRAQILCFFLLPRHYGRPVSLLHPFQDSEAIAIKKCTTDEKIMWIHCFPDISSKLNDRAVNVSITPSAVPIPEPRSPIHEDDDSSDGENESIPVLRLQQELSSAEIWERERKLRELREKLRAEETKLVLLKKIRQSQQPVLQSTKESNTATGTTLAGSGCVVPPGVTVTPAPPPAHQHAKRSTTNSAASIVPATSVTSGRSSNLPGGATLTPGSYRSQVESCLKFFFIIAIQTIAIVVVICVTGFIMKEKYRSEGLLLEPESIPVVSLHPVGLLLRPESILA